MTRTCTQRLYLLIRVHKHPSEFHKNLVSASFWDKAMCLYIYIKLHIYIYVYIYIRSTTSIQAPAFKGSALPMRSEDDTMSYFAIGTWRHAQHRRVVGGFIGFGKDIDLMGESSRWGLENQIATIVTIPLQTDLFKKIHLHLTYTKIWNCHKMFMIWLSYWMISLITPFLRLKQLLCALIVPFYQTFLGIHYRQTLSAIHWKSELSQQETSLPTRFTMKRCFWGPPPCDQTVLL